MEIIEHLQQGSLPQKMVNWPLNLEAARQLANKYDQLAETGGVETAYELNQITGFGSNRTCTLCIAARYDALFCDRCLYYNGAKHSCGMGEARTTYENLDSFPDPVNLRDRASFIRSVINRFE